MQRNPLLAVVVIVCLTAIVIAWSPWAMNGRFAICSPGVVLDTSTGKRWTLHGQGLAPLQAYEAPSKTAIEDIMDGIGGAQESEPK